MAAAALSLSALIASAAAMHLAFRTANAVENAVEAAAAMARKIHDGLLKIILYSPCSLSGDRQLDVATAVRGAQLVVLLVGHRGSE